jgi:uncharacterized membrane protein
MFMADPVHSSPGSSGLAPNVAGALAYLLGPITGILFLVIEKENRFVRFHAAQSIVVGVAMVLLYIVLTVLSTILAVIPILGWIIGLLLTLIVGLGSFVLWLLLMYQAFQGREWQLPVLAPYARRMISSPTP